MNAPRYYSRVTKLLRRKGIDDGRITSTLNDIKGWVKQHPDEYPNEHFGPAAHLVRDLPRGNEIHAPQNVLAGTLVATLALMIAQFVFGFFSVSLIFLGIPAAIWGLLVLVIGFIAFLNVGGTLPEGFNP